MEWLHQGCDDDILVTFLLFFLIFGVDHFSSVISLKKTKSYFSALAP